VYLRVDPALIDWICNLLGSLVQKKKSTVYFFTYTLKNPTLGEIWTNLAVGLNV